MKANKLEFEEISKDQILVGDTMAQEMIKKVKNSEIGSYIAVGLTVLLIYLWKPTWVGIIIMIAIGVGTFSAFEKTKARWEEKLQNYYLTKKAANPDFQYFEEKDLSDEE
jgi:hypothetical protein